MGAAPESEGKGSPGRAEWCADTGTSAWAFRLREPKVDRCLLLRPSSYSLLSGVDCCPDVLATGAGEASASAWADGGLHRGPFSAQSGRRCRHAAHPWASEDVGPRPCPRFLAPFGSQAQSVVAGLEAALGNRPPPDSHVRCRPRGRAQENKPRPKGTIPGRMLVPMAAMWASVPPRAPGTPPRDRSNGLVTIARCVATSSLTPSRWSSTGSAAPTPRSSRRRRTASGSLGSSRRSSASSVATQTSRRCAV